MKGDRSEDCYIPGAVFAKYSIQTTMKMKNTAAAVMINDFQVAGAWAAWSMGICGPRSL
jgi:hypothetical protein